MGIAGFALGAIDAYFEFQEIQLTWFAPLHLTPLHLGFLLFAVAAFTLIVKLVISLKRLKDSKPIIEVVAMPEGHYARLGITNNGHAAHFIAKAQRVIDDQLVDTAWPIQWHSSLQDKQEIFKDSQGILDIASRSWSIRRKEPIIRFHTARQSHWSTFEAGSETNTYSFDLSPSDTTVEIEVTILADPELRTPFRKRYTLNLTDDEITLGATVAVSL